MTSLPITIPQGYTLLVKKGDFVSAGDPLARQAAAPDGDISQVTSDVVIDLSQMLGLSPDAIRKYLQKSPGDSVSIGDVLVSHTTTLGLKKDRIISQVDGTVIRFERDTGRLVIQTNEGGEEKQSSSMQEENTIISPLAGTISVCNNGEIVIETESKTLVGTAGTGGTIKAKIVALEPNNDAGSVTGDEITKVHKGLILLLPNIEKEALAKAAVVEVGGILGTELSEDVIVYMKKKKIEIPTIVIDAATGKKLLKLHKEIVLHGDQKTIVLED